MNANPAFAASPAPALKASGRATGLGSLDAYRIALDACRVGSSVARSLSANLRDQLLRASSSAVLNIAEGFGSSSRGVKRRHYGTARGSAMECVAILDLASAIGMGEGVGDGIRNAKVLFTRVAMMTARLVARFR